VTEEEWRPIPGWPGYSASSLGRIYSDRPWRGTPGRILSGGFDRKGYRRVIVNDAPRRCERYVHHLVAEAFHGPRPVGMDTRHLDGDKTNNSPTNLRYGSRSENELDKVRHGTHHNSRKTHCLRGHPFDADNTRIYRGERVCRACQHERYVERIQRAAGIRAA
jgi:hypothetical protein